MLKTLPAAAAIVAVSAAAGGLLAKQGAQGSGSAQDRLDARYKVYTAALAAL